MQTSGKDDPPRPTGPIKADIKAVIDVGSNSVLLLVEERDGDRWRPVYEATAVTALGEGTKSTGLLGEPRMSATLEAVGRFFAEARAHGAGEIFAAATMAARIATNTPEFLGRAEAQGTPIVVLSGEDEAAYGFQSVADDPAFARFDRLSIIDPGGQSTELVTARRTLSPIPDGSKNIAPSRATRQQTRGSGIGAQTDPGGVADSNGTNPSAPNWDVRFRKSFPVGTLGLRSQILTEEASDPPAILKASAAIDDVIGLCYLPGEAGEVVVLGATGTNLVSIRDGLTSWEPERVHGAYLTFEEISRAVGSLMPLTDAERGAIVGMEPGRERTIHIGALVLERFLNATGAPGVWVSVRGWRHALLERL